jgi:hypothetical protein
MTEENQDGGCTIAASVLNHFLNAIPAIYLKSILACWRRKEEILKSHIRILN